MALRLVEFSVPVDSEEQVRDMLAQDPPIEPWDESRNNSRLAVKLLLDAERTGSIVDRIEHTFGDQDEFRLIISAVEASLPRREREKEQEAAEQEDGESTGATIGVSREELYNDVWDMTVLSRVMIATSGLSSIVAAVGMMRDSVAVIIGAMVIAPLLGPNVGLALGTTLSDRKLLWRAAKANFVGSSVALLLSIAIGLIFTVDLQSEELALRTQVGLSDIALALSAGAAGVLALTTGVSAALVGVMVAVALMPPTVAMGLMVGSGEWVLAGGAFLLLSTNVICINLAGTLTFFIQGVRPLTWWEADRARKMAWGALGIWTFMLVALAVVIVLAGGPKKVSEESGPTESATQIKEEKQNKSNQPAEEPGSERVPR